MERPRTIRTKRTPQKRFSREPEGSPKRKGKPKTGRRESKKVKGLVRLPTAHVHAGLASKGREGQDWKGVG